MFIPNSLKEFRISFGLTREDLASILDVSPTQIYRLETNLSNYSYSFIQRFIEQFPDVSLHFFFETKHDVIITRKIKDSNYVFGLKEITFRSYDWGNDSEETHQLGKLILLDFISEDVAVTLADEFTRDFLLFMKDEGEIISKQTIREWLYEKEVVLVKEEGEQYQTLDVLDLLKEHINRSPKVFDQLKDQGILAKNLTIIDFFNIIEDMKAGK